MKVFIALANQSISKQTGRREHVIKRGPPHCPVDEVRGCLGVLYHPQYNWKQKTVSGNLNNA